jgi:hypothetical protein
MTPDQEPGPRGIILAGLRAVREIDQRDVEDIEALVYAFLCAAWPSRRAQNQ